MPDIPIDGGPYVAAAYILFVLLLVVYIGIMAAKLGRISRELEEVAEVAEKRKRAGAGDAVTSPPRSGSEAAVAPSSTEAAGHDPGGEPTSVR